MSELSKNIDTRCNNNCNVDSKSIADKIAYCGHFCDYCTIYDGCSCKGDNHCGKRLSPIGCYQYDCCRQKGLNGCWECPDAPCGVDMLAEIRVKFRAFVRCIKEDGVENFIHYLKRNKDNGIIYTKEEYRGDYDLDTEEAVLKLLRTGKL